MKFLFKGRLKENISFSEQTDILSNLCIKYNVLAYGSAGAHVLLHIVMLGGVIPKLWLCCCQAIKTTGFCK